MKISRINTLQILENKANKVKNSKFQLGDISDFKKTFSDFECMHVK